jgi:outer membrane protein
LVGHTLKQRMRYRIDGGSCGRTFLGFVFLFWAFLVLPISSVLGFSDEVQKDDKVLDLDSFLIEALGHNIGLRIERINSLNAIDAVEVERAAFDPRFQSNYNYVEREAAAASSTLDTAPIPRSESRQLSVGADKRFSAGTAFSINSNINRVTSNNNAARNPDYAADIGFGIRQPLMRGAWQTVNLAPIARAKIGGEQAVDRLMDAILEVLSSAEIAYWNLAYARARRDFFASSLLLAKSILEESQVRQELGLATQLEILQADAEVVSREEELILAELQIEDSLDRLIRVAGSNFDQALWTGDLQIAALPEPINEPLSIEAVSVKANQADMRVRAQERQVEIQRLNRLLAADQARPDLDLTLGLRYLGRDDSGWSSYRGSWSGDGYNLNAGIQVSLPWGFREARARERQAGRNLEREEWVLADLRMERTLLVRDVWRQLSSGLKRIEVTKAAVNLNEQSFEQARARFASGAVAYRLVLEAQRDLDQSRLRYLAAVIETLRAEVRLARLDGSILERNGFEWDNEILRVGPVAGR